MTAPALRTRPPTGRVPWPLILVEGAEKSGKSWAAAILSTSPRIGRTFWFDLGEGAGDEYGAIPGVRYEIVEHDGTWQTIMPAVEEIRDIARTAAAAGEPPVVIVIDSMTLIWDMLKDWVTNRARKAPANRKLLAEDPNADINISSNFWNDANTRHRRLMTILMTFPGIAVVTARGKEISAMTNGQPDPRKAKEYRVEGQKDLAFDATVWLRLSRAEHPTIVGARSVHAGIVPGEDRPLKKPGLTLEQLIFDVLRCDPATAQVRDLVTLEPGDAGPDGEPAVATVPQVDEPPAVSARARELTAEIGASDDADKLTNAWRAISSALKAGEISNTEADKLATYWKSRKNVLPLTKDQHAHMHVLWNQAGFANDRDGRLHFTAEIVGRDIASSNELRAADYPKVVERLKAFIQQNTPPAGEDVSTVLPDNRELVDA